jgi:recombinational DNA repair protein RecR
MTKKNEVAERPVNEKRFCKKCEYYYSEFFTCPICYGEQRAKERIIKLLESSYPRLKGSAEWAIALIKGEK